VRWLVADSLYCREQFPFSHLDSYSYYLSEAGEFVRYTCLNIPLGSNWSETAFMSWDRLLMLDRYERVLEIEAEKRIAQVAAICSPMPWEVRKPDGSPAFDLVISSIPWMVEAARAAGCRAEYQQLCFDTRALVCGMGVERDIDCLFVGTVDANHRKRAAVLAELDGLVTITPPTFGRDFYKLMSRTKTCVQIHAEWAMGARNALRIYETIGLGGLCVTDGATNGVPGWEIEGNVRKFVEDALMDFGEFAREEQGAVLTRHTYVQRIPQLLAWAKAL